MSTRSRIGIKNNDDTFTSVYVHFDGYLSHHGPILLTYYTTEEKVRELLAPGDMSRLGERVEPLGPHDFDRPERGTCVYYGRDRGENDVDALTSPDKESIMAEEWGYCFDPETGTWEYNDHGDGWLPLTDKAIANDE